MAKVVDDMLYVGRGEVLGDFHTQISKRFHIGRYIVDQQLVINDLLINRKQSGGIQCDMDEYMQSLP